MNTNDIIDITPSKEDTVSTSTKSRKPRTTTAKPTTAKEATPMTEKPTTEETPTMHRVKTRMVDGEIVHLPVPTMSERFDNLGDDALNVVKATGTGTVKATKATGRGLVKGVKFLGRGLKKVATETVEAPKTATKAIVEVGEGVRLRHQGKKALYEAAAREANVTDEATA